MTEVESELSIEAQKRKERLAELRAKHSKGAKTESKDESLALPKPVFRSYQPNDDNLKESKMGRPDLVRPEDFVKDQLEAAKAEQLAAEIDVTTLAPRKPDWDLKRDVNPMLERLERRTQRAIAEIIRERLEAEKKSSDSDWSKTVSQGAGV